MKKEYEIILKHLKGAERWINTLLPTEHPSNPEWLNEERAALLEAERNAKQAIAKVREAAALRLSGTTRGPAPVHADGTVAVWCSEHNHWRFPGHQDTEDRAR